MYIPKLEQNLDIKSPVVMRSTLVSRALRISLKQRPISFLLILLTAQISYGHTTIEVEPWQEDSCDNVVHTGL